MSTIHTESVRSPYQAMREDAVNIKSKDHPVADEVRKCVGTYELKAVVEEDSQTLAALQTDNLVAFLCTLKREGIPLAQGRGSVVISPTTNRFYQRAIAAAFNSALADAAIRATKVLDLVRKRPVGGGDIDQLNDNAPATEKQRALLNQLLYDRVQNKSEREKWLGQVPTISRFDASELIANLLEGHRR